MSIIGKICHIPIGIVYILSFIVMIIVWIALTIIYFLLEPEYRDEIIISTKGLDLYRNMRDVYYGNFDHLS